MTLRRLGVAVGLALVAVLGLASPAAAHTALVFTSPSADTAVTGPPDQLTLVFSEPVGVTGSTVTLTGGDDDRKPVGVARVSGDGRVVTVPIEAALPPGVYRVGWTVASGDGDLVTGEFGFGVGDTTGTTPTPADSVPWGRTLSTTVLRWILFAGLAVALGGLAGERIARRALGRSNPAWVVGGAVAVTGAAIALAVLLVTQTGLDVVWGPAGRILVIETVGGALAAVLAATRWRRWSPLPLILVVGAEAARSHVHEAAGLAGSAITAVHLTAVALWVGALVHVLREARPFRDDPDLVRPLFRGYVRLALAAFLAVVASGTLAGLLLVDIGDIAATPYSRTLLAKLAAVAAVAGLALIARRRLRAGRAEGVLRPARAEVVALVAVLAVSAALVTLAPPTPAGTGLPFPPPALGVTVPVAARAGQIGVAVRASDGQLVVELTAPGLDDQIPGQPAPPSPRYGITGLLATPHESAAAVPFQACGVGCYLAPARWVSGVSRLTLSVTAEGWAGGRVSLLLPWPGRAEPGLLTQVTQVMAKIPSLTIYETVTSDTSSPDPTSVVGVTVSGQEFLASDPYSTGVAPIVTVVDHLAGGTRLLLAFPADQYTIDLIIDPRGRIERETLTTAKHLVIRTITYPEADQ